MPNIAHQYRTIVAGSGFRRTIERGHLEFHGADRTAFLQALVTNDLGSLAIGQGTYAALLTPQGRMVTDLHVFLRADRIVADVPASLVTSLCGHFDQLIFAEDVRVADASASLTQVAVLGDDSTRILATVLGISANSLAALKLWEQVDVPGGFVARTDDAKTDSFGVFVEAGGEATLLEALRQAGSLEMSDALALAIRVDLARPAFGADMTTETIPLEAGLLERAISTTKGCYVGQELVIRVLHRGGGRVARRLVKISFSSGPAPEIGASLFSEGREIGRITSVAESLNGAGVNALGYLARDAAAVGQPVVVHSGQVGGTVVALAG